MGSGFTSLNSNSADIARDLFVTLSSKMAERQVARPPIYQDIATVVPSGGKSQRFDFAKALAEVREWGGEYVYNKLMSLDYELTNRDWSSGLEWKRDDLEDDQTGSLKLAIDEHVNAMFEHPDDLFVRFLNHQIAGTTSEFGVGFDGKTVFSATHSWSAGYTSNQSNLRSGTNTGKLDLTYGYDNIQEAYQKLSDGFFWPHHNGGEIGRIKSTPTHILCSSSVYFNCQRLLDSQQVVSGSTATYGLPASNVLNKLGLKAVLIPGLTAGYWIMADLSVPVRFALFQRRKEIETTFQGPGTTAWDEHRVARINHFARYAVGQGLWYRGLAGDGT